jgi:hypothetical protein
MLGGAAIGTASAQFNPATLISETLRYRLLSGSVEVGSSTVTISRDNATGIIQFVESISGLFEQTAVVTIRDDTSLQPLHAHIIISRDNRDQELKLTYRDGGRSVSGEIQRQANWGGSRLVNAALANGTVDLYTIPHLFRASPLSVNKTFQFPFFNGFHTEKGMARAWVSRIETVVVPAGAFDSYRLETYVGNARLILNIAAKPPHRIVRQILPELEVKFELEKFECHSHCSQLPPQKNSYALPTK